MCILYTRGKFEVSSIILTPWERGNFMTPPNLQNKPLKRPPRLGLKAYLNAYLFRIFLTFPNSLSFLKLLCTELSVETSANF